MVEENFFTRPTFIICNRILIAITLVSLLLWVLSFTLPKSLNVLNIAKNVSVYVEPEKQTKVTWLNNDRTRYSCVFNEKKQGFRCGYDVQLSATVEAGIDLQYHDYILLDMEYSGPANKIRMSYRNALPGAEGIAYWGKQHEITVPLQNGGNRLILDFDQTTIPIWWREQASQLDPSDLIKERDNIVNLALDIETPFPIGTHTFEIKNIRIVNKWSEILGPLPLKIIFICNLLFVLAINAFPMTIRVKQLKEKKSRDQVFFERVIGNTLNSETEGVDIQTSPGLLKQERLLEMLACSVDFTQNQLSVIALSFKFDDENNLDNSEFVGNLVMQIRLTMKFMVKHHYIVAKWTDNQIIVIFPAGRIGSVKKVAANLLQNLSSNLLPENQLAINTFCKVIQVNRQTDARKTIDAMFEHVN